MSRYEVKIDRQAARTLARLDKPIRRRVQRRIDDLAGEPRPPGVEALKSASGMLKIRVGDYRIVYTVRDHELLVLVVDVGHRSVVYRSW